MEIKHRNAESHLCERKERAKPGLAVPNVTPDFENLVTNLTVLAESLRGIQELGIAQYTPVVESIINTRSRDVTHIEHTLDHLLDFACLPAGLLLYRRLCRHYWDIDPAATAAYIQSYREMWDAAGEEAQP